MEGEIRHWLSSPATQVALQDHCLVTKIVVGATTYSAALVVGGDIPYSSGNIPPGCWGSIKISPS